MQDTPSKSRPPFSIDEDRPSDWFEPLYSGASKSGDGVPWANMATHPSFALWLEAHPVSGEGQTALVVGCGLGDDAIELEGRGFTVTAFDVAASAIDLCKQRFPDSTVKFLQADLLEDQPDWRRAFDFVLEIFTVQALPPKYEEQLIKSISDFVAPGGKLLVVAEVSDAQRDFAKGPPWVLTRDHVEAFVACGLELVDTVIETRGAHVGKATYVSEFRRR
ncbi:class I SAM-dependent methyltransferase [Aliiroseovarius sp. S1123]|uniref:class I SAM-dependent methyltransferase n=1 Tax=unclassified Aliiroseovarius TaxID=2623558 RepID=UPI001FF238F8|nr:class I SAM-dependent methyltransferase [Aliiroseovarius sp. S1123]MCK0170830.1 class I SAM-dependent methyltransferase [Aliiroseovarius sp. S1123]